MTGWQSLAVGFCAGTSVGVSAALLYLTPSLRRAEQAARDARRHLDRLADAWRDA